MTLPTDDDPKLLVVVATITAKPGKEQEVKDLLSSIVEPSLAENGCVGYALHQGVADPATFITYENWTSQEALDAHLAGPAVQQGLGVLGPLVAVPPLIVPLNRIA
ncbi:MAG: antibiotic biosynthesis monooxygenase [Pseudonocardiales bacterium]|nr:antibiotic biosynthesis monooxygenase [Pseudonocardiales bacterium]